MSQISQNQPSHDEYQEPTTQDNNLPYDYLHNKNIFQYLNTTDNKNIDELLQATRKLQPEFVPIPEISSLKIERDRLVDEIAVKAIVDRLKEALSLCNNKNYINCEEYTKLMDTINSNLDTSVINNTENKEENNTSTLLKYRVEVIEDILKKHVKDSDILDILIEVKKLKLYKKQKILQKSVQRGVKNMLTPKDILTLDNNYNIYKDIVIEEGLKRKYEENIEKQKKYKRIAFCKIIEDQYKKIKTYINAKVNKKDKIYKCVQTYITSFKKQEQKKQDKIFKERIKNMKHNDIEYKNFIDSEKKKRIGYINTKIEEYINTIDINKKEDNITSDKDTKNSIESIDRINKDNNINKNINSISKDKIEQPATLNINLYDYQLSTIKWLLYLYNNKYNGIISFKKDNGRTVSLISYILYLIENKNITQPFLIIVPSPTILSNYTYEINKCSSLIKAVEYKGSAEQRKILQTEINQDDTNIILTTYKYIIKDKAYLSKINYLYLIIDDRYNEYDREMNIDKYNF
ncbi:SNF2 domain containing protein [Spraguea lophii 42_110]|uniref:SNF2 domain containing protein n=1 Tax=Spraguea lophii (strain 42_110) TaxID=1358809 RepID=S7XP33_SPRLO|nr:SNF2 domain containing protein [Spraguea lophii 42_110]